MAMTFTNAKAFVARILGAEGDTVQLTVAEDAIKAAIQEWNIRHDWSYLLMDTSNGFSVASCANTSGAVTTSTTNGFAGVNIGQTFTISDGLPAGTYTVSAVNSTTSITVTGGGGDFTGETLVFSADIPIIVGTDTYRLPSPVKRPYSARLLTNERTLVFKEQREIDRSFSIQTPQSTPLYYNVFNTATFATTTQNGKLRLFPIPGVSDTARIRYFRPIAEPSGGSDNLDTLDRYIYALLELARYYFLKDHDSETTRLAETKERAEAQLVRAIADDQQGSEDRDLALIPLVEHGIHRQLDSDDIRFELF